MYIWEEQSPLSFNNPKEDEPTLTPYLLNRNEVFSLPAIIICPGGGYHHLANHEGEPVAKWLNSIGIHAFVLNYRVFPNHYPAPQLDVKRAIQFVRFHANEWNIDSNRIGVLGFSAGGHLASTAATLFDRQFIEPKDEIDMINSRPDLAILCYPVISFLSYYHEGSLKNLLGQDSSLTVRTFLSSEKNVSKKTPPTFLWHTADDKSVPVQNSLMFAESLSQYEIPYELHIYQNGRHGLGLAIDYPEVAMWTKSCEIWLRKQGF